MYLMEIRKYIYHLMDNTDGTRTTSYPASWADEICIQAYRDVKRNACNDASWVQLYDAEVSRLVDLRRDSLGRWRQ
jgi:hypothetical protein